MIDPYTVLGVKSDASDEEIKHAYRELARKYHPGNYQNNPLADPAEGRMKEISEAYDAITKMRSGGGASDGYQSQGVHRGFYQGGYQQQYFSASPGSLYNQVWQAIDMGDIGRVEQLLRGAVSQDAERHFLTGSIAYHKGWLDEAIQHFQMACNMDPANGEYRQALMMMRQGGQAYRPYGYGGGVDACDCYTACFCMNMCCGNRAMRNHIEVGVSRVALVGVLVALSLIALYLSAVSPTARMGTVAIAGLFPVEAVVSAGLKAELFCYGAVGLLGPLLAPDKTNALLYLLSFGLWSTPKSLLERIPARPLEWLCKLAVSNTVLSLFWFGLHSLFLPLLPETLQALWMVYAAGNTAFVIYDVDFSKLISFYVARVDRVLRKTS